MVKKWGRKLLSLFLALVLALAMSVTAFAFSDTRGHWAEETIQAMTEKGYLSGYPDGTFGPNNTIRRAEFMRILTSMYGLTERSDAYILWTDVRSDAWYAPCMGAGLLLPLYPGHYIYPEEPLTRLDAAYAILMTHDIEFDYESTSAQSMGDYAGYAGDADVCAVISTALDRGIMKGTGSGFAPYEYMTRAELCTLLSRLNPEEADVEKLNGIIDGLIDDVAASAPAQGVPGTVEGYSEEYEQALFEMVNTARTENGLPALSWSNALAGIARNHGADMIPALNEYAGLREQAQGFDLVQLYEARQAIRPGKEQEAENRAQEVYGEKYNPLLMFDSKKSVSRMLHEDIERQAVRRMM